MTRRLQLLAAAVALVLTSACATGRAATAPVAAVPAATATAWPKAYLDAIADALDPEPGEVATNLVAITRTNSRLQWRAFPDGDRVLMVSLVDNPSFYPPAPGAAYNNGTHDIWVTAVPEVKTLCSAAGFGGTDLGLRLTQLFGIVPSYKPAAFVELWVLPSQLFRPAADNEITDTTAGLTMPATTEAWYRKWFNELRAKQYFQSASPKNDAYPWTQLGYTYDWGSANHQGPSEFVIRQQSPLFVNAITPYREYCASPVE